jgi:hypothetical protein
MKRLLAIIAATSLSIISLADKATVPTGTTEHKYIPVVIAAHYISVQTNWSPSYSVQTNWYWSQSDFYTNGALKNCTSSNIIFGN